MNGGHGGPRDGAERKRKVFPAAAIMRAEQQIAEQWSELVDLATAVAMSEESPI